MAHASIDVRAMTHLHGPRVVIRPFAPGDAVQVLEAIDESRASLTRWIPDIGRRASVVDVRLGLEQLRQARLRDERLVCGIWDRADRFLGEVGLHDLDWATRSCSVGYWLRLSARGCGLADEGLSLLESFAFGELHLQRLAAFIAPLNLPSRRVVERRGYLQNAWRRADPQWDGETDVMLQYELTPDRRERY